MSTGITTTLSSIAAAINAEHGLACKHAETAVEHARRAGQLLLQAKSTLGHGKFLPWVASTCTVSQRQAQRYMAAAQGKPLPIRQVKNDTASHLDYWAEIDRHHIEVDPLARMVAFHKPAAGPVSMIMFVVEPATAVGFYFISKVEVHRETEDGMVDTMRRPVAERAVGFVLNSMGSPASLEWGRLPADPAVKPWAAQFFAEHA